MGGVCNRKFGYVDGPPQSVSQERVLAGMIFVQFESMCNSVTNLWCSFGFTLFPTLYSDKLYLSSIPRLLTLDEEEVFRDVDVAVAEISAAAECVVRHLKPLDRAKLF
jgi:hypothetical protein